MKKSVLALAALGAFAGAASAQSSVTVYGRVDMSLAQQADAVANREMRAGSGNRLGFRGVEDLGGGLKAVFQIEHRFNADTGTQNNANAFWHGKSIVGLEGSFGRVTLGREENAAYLLGQAGADPWGGTDTVAANTFVNGRIGAQRYNNSINYAISRGGLQFGAQLAETNDNTPAGGVAEDRPYSLGLAYKTGGFHVGVGYEDPADKDDHWASVFLAYNFGAFKIGGFYGSGKNVNAQKHEAYLLQATARVGAGELRATYGELKNKSLAANNVLDKQFGLGYHYALSKRTTVYADVTNENRDNIPGDRKKTGYDIGLKHNF